MAVPNVNYPATFRQLLNTFTNFSFEVFRKLTFSKVNAYNFFKQLILLEFNGFHLFKVNTFKLKGLQFGATV
jgi:hypothetical protein